MICFVVGPIGPIAFTLEGVEELDEEGGRRRGR